MLIYVSVRFKRVNIGALINHNKFSFIVLSIDKLNKFISHEITQHVIIMVVALLVFATTMTVALSYQAIMTKLTLFDQFQFTIRHLFNLMAEKRMVHLYIYI